MKVVNKYIEVRIYPSKKDNKDNSEKIASINEIESHIGIYRFIYNKELEFINYFRQLLKQNGFPDKVLVNQSSCEVILKMLIQEYVFLKKAESSSRQQSQKDLVTAFKRYFKHDLKSEYPVLKKRKKTRKFTFRIMNNNNNIRITKDKNGYHKIKLAKLGLIKFKTSKKYKELLLKGSDPHDNSVKIKHVVIKRVNSKYYAVFNIECIHIPVKLIGLQQMVGIDIGCSELAVLSNGEKILNLNLEKETQKIIKYQKMMSHHNKSSYRYKKAKKLYNKLDAQTS